MKTCLYRHYGANNKLLYIGVSVNPYERSRQHSVNKKYFHKVVRIELKWYKTKKDALMEESRLIKNLHPACNIAHRTNNRKTFLKFYESLTEADILMLADKAKTSVNYLYQISAGIRKPGASVSARLKAADNRITDSMLRPDRYAWATTSNWWI